MATKPKEMTKGEAAKMKRKEDALARIKADATEIAKLDKEIKRRQDKMGKQAKIARNNGAQYAELSEATGRSHTWVQQALEKAGYEPRTYKKKKKGEDAA